MPRTAAFFRRACSGLGLARRAAPTAAVAAVVATTVASFGLTGTATPAGAQTAELGEGFLCCNLRSDGRWISDSNYLEAGKTLIPFGTPLRFAGFGRYRVFVEIDGQRQAIGNDYSRSLTMDAFARRYIVKDDPRIAVAAAEPKIRRAIESARVTRGMNRDQVLVAIGYPIVSENPHLDAAVWKYWLWSFSPYQVHFDAEGRVSRVSSDADTLAVVFLP